MISDRELPRIASWGALLAYLAYLEALERNGYAGIALGNNGSSVCPISLRLLRSLGILNPGSM